MDTVETTSECVTAETGNTVADIKSIVKAKKSKTKQKKYKPRKRPCPKSGRDIHMDRFNTTTSIDKPNMPKNPSIKRHGLNRFDVDDFDVIDGKLVPKEQVRKTITREENIVRARRGKPPRILPYEEAIEVIKNENLDTGREYRRWVVANNSYVLPLYPERAYRNVWGGWKEYLSTPDERVKQFGNMHNQFKYLKYSLAREWVHTLKLKNKTEWMEFVNQSVRNGTFPTNIPRNPSVGYRRYWVSWSYWLGSTSAGVVDLALELHDMKNIGTLIVGKDNAEPMNVYYIQTINGTPEQAELSVNKYNRTSGTNVNILAMFDITATKDEIKNIISVFVPSGLSTAAIVSNIHQLLWELSVHSDRI